MPRPKEIADTGLFTYDHRHDGDRFWFVERPIRPVVMVGQEGRFIRPGMIEDETMNHAGNVASPDVPVAFLDGQVWLIDQIGVFNGGAAAKLMGVQIAYGAAAIFLGSDAAVGIIAPQEMLHVPLMIDEVVNTQVVVGGAAADLVSVHARRVA